MFKNIFFVQSRVDRIVRAKKNTASSKNTMTDLLTTVYLELVRSFQR